MKKIMTEKEQESEVIIKLKGWQIPYLLGACRLGIWAEDWCAGLMQTASGSYDTHSNKWIFKVAHIIDTIKQQSDFDIEETEYGNDEVLNAIDYLIDAQCVTNQKNLEKQEEERIALLESNKSIEQMDDEKEFREKEKKFQEDLLAKVQEEGVTPQMLQEAEELSNFLKEF